jgi:hypothetical protein
VDHVYTPYRHIIFIYTSAYVYIGLG